MRSKKRKDTNKDLGSLTITILPDGKILLPRDPALKELASALGDKGAVEFCEQAKLSKVHIGKRLCG